MTDRKRRIFLGCMAGFVVFLVLGAITSAWYDNRQKLLEEQAQKATQAEQARQAEQAEKVRQAEETQRQAEKAQRQAEAEKFSIHCGELEDKYNANPLKDRPYGAEVSDAELKERDAEYDAKDECWKQYQALEKEINPPPTLPPGTVTLDSQRSKAFRYRDMTSQSLGAAAGDQMYECVVHGFNGLPTPPVTVEGVPPLSAADISACNDLYARLNSAIERFNRGY